MSGSGWGADPIVSDTNLPAPNFDVASPLAAAQQYQQRQIGLQSDQTALQSAQIGLQEEKEQQPVKSSQLQDALIADAARKALDDPENADSYFQKAADLGAVGAKQYIGRPFNPFTLQRTLEAYGGGSSNQAIAPQSSLSAATAPAPASGGSANAQLAINSTEMMDRQYANMPPQQIIQASQHVNAALGSLYQVMHSQNPAQEWDRQVAQLKADGVPVPEGISYSPLQVAQLYQNLSARAPYLQDRAAQISMGLPAPLIPTNVKELGGGGYNVPAYTPNGEINATGTPGGATEVVAPSMRSQYVGMTPDGKPISLDTRTGGYTVGGQPYNGPINPKLTGTALTFKMKQDAAKLVYPNDPEKAMLLAQGKSQFTPQQTQQAAARMAQRDYDADVAAGTPPPEGFQNFINTRTQAYSRQLSGAAPPPAPAPAPTPAAAAPPAGTTQNPNVPPPPPTLAARPGLMWHPKSQTYSDSTGARFNKTGAPVPAPAPAGG